MQEQEYKIENINKILEKRQLIYIEKQDTNIKVQAEKKIGSLFWMKNQNNDPIFYIYYQKYRTLSINVE